MTIFPFLKMRAVVFGFKMRIIKAPKRLGLYYELLVLDAIYRSLRWLPI